ncbi:MAG: D-alanyl-D-alanine carboxypeptidase [Candidatus Pacebacteria bacterium]|nr:D-alanyl-D-alanine carboxypeptidase [Candidatus Paceibacterota bacterium]
MVENLAIVLLVFLSQLGVVSEGQNNAEFLTKLIKSESIEEKFIFQEENWNYYNENIKLENKLFSLPNKIKDDYIDIDSNSAIAFDTETDFVLYSKSSNEKMPIASISKIMTALVVLENSKLDNSVVISENAYNTEGRKEGLSVREEISVENLMKIMIVGSNNVAATAFAEHIGGNVDNFVILMNEKVKELGLKDTIFYNSTGLDQKNMNVSTAFDIAQLVDYSLNIPLIWEYSTMQSVSVSSLDGKLKHNVKNTNLLLGKMENIAGGKTGFTDQAGECLVLISNKPEENRKVITVVLGASDRFLQTEKLRNWVFENYEW